MPIVSVKGSYSVEGDRGNGAYKNFMKASLLETGLTVLTFNIYDVRLAMCQ